jgi:hypothetical protein
MFIPLVVGGIVILVVIALSSIDGEEAVWSILFGAMAGALAIVLSMLIMLIPAATIHPQYEIVSQQEYALARVRSGQEIEGSFFLGIGSVSSNVNYNYCIDYGGGNYTVHQISGNNIMVHERPELTSGKLVVSKWMPKSGVYKLFLWNMYSSRISYDFYVPEGSIVREYSI